LSPSSKGSHVRAFLLIRKALPQQQAMPVVLLTRREI
jgi:hypothetical protein